MKMNIEAPDFTKEWLCIKEELPEVKKFFEEQYSHVQKTIKFKTIIFIYGLSSMILLICGFFQPFNGFLEMLLTSYPVVFRILAILIALGVMLMMGTGALPGSFYPSGHTKPSFEAEYKGLIHSVDQLFECTEYSNAMVTWRKNFFLFAKGTPWFSFHGEYLAKLMNSLSYIEYLTKVPELVSYDITDDAKIKVSYATETGDINTTKKFPCKVKENTKIEYPTLSWSREGLVLMIPYNHQ